MSLGRGEEKVVAYSFTALGGIRIPGKKELQRDLNSVSLPLRDTCCSYVYHLQAERLRDQASAPGV